MSMHVVRTSARFTVAGIGFLIGNGCSPFAHLGPITTGNRVASGTEMGSVRILRKGASVNVAVGMRLKKADQISTSIGTRAVITFRAGYEVILDSSTTITVENPSILVRFGQAFIRKLGNLVGSRPDSLPVHAGNASFLPRGTEFIVSVPDSERVVISVLEGLVVARSKTLGWPPVEYRALEQGTVVRGQPPGRMRSLGTPEAAALFAWVREVDRLTTVQIPRLIGQSEASAKQQLAQLGLVPRIQYEANENQQPGLVLRQIPEADAPLRPGETVSLTVVSKPAATPPPSTTVPAVMGHQVTDATREIEAASLRVGRLVYREDSSVTRDAVIGTEPGVGSPADSGQRVTLIVRGCRVPLLSPGTTTIDAQRRIQSAGLHPAPQGKGDRVKSQKTEPNSVVRCGAPVSYDTESAIRH